MDVVQKKKKLLCKLYFREVWFALNIQYLFPFFQLFHTCIALSLSHTKCEWLMLQLYKDATSSLVMVAYKLGKTWAWQKQVILLQSLQCDCATSSWISYRCSTWSSIMVLLLTYNIIYNLLLKPDYQLKLVIRCLWWEKNPNQNNQKKRVPSQLNPHFPAWCVHELEDKCIDQHYVPWWLSLHSAIFKYNFNPVLTTLYVILKH